MLKIAMVEIKLLSETIFGGDGEQIDITDIDIQTDSHGFPYYAGRTLKGVIREQAEWYTQCMSENTKLNNALYKLFGKPHEDNRESLRFGNAKLADAIYDFVKQNSLSKQDVFAALTDVRSMTSLDQTGSAKKGSLRQVRVMRSGYVFYAPIFVQDELNETERDLLEKSVKLVRHIGLMRHRGKGEVECKLRWLNDKKQQPLNAKHIGPHYELTIQIHEPLKISHVLGTSDSTHSLKYIPGAVLRGALVHAYLQSTGKSPDELNTRQLFDPKYTQFWNGYIELAGQRSTPFPHHLFEPKDQAKSECQNRKIYNALDHTNMNEIQALSPVKVARNGMVINPSRDDSLLVGKVNTTSSMHISVNGGVHRGQSKQSQLYRFEAIAPQQTFKAVVYLNGDHSFANWLREQSVLSLWLGGSRNSGYGHVTVSVSAIDQSPEQSIFKYGGKSRDLYIMATSDWIVRDEQGKLRSSLHEKWLEEQLEVSLKWQDQIVNTQLSGGYISQWKAYQPMISAVQAGSIFRYEILSGTLDLDKVKRLIERGVGERVNEGFGRLIMFDTWPYTEIEEVKTESLDSNTIPRGERESDSLQLDMLKRNLIQIEIIQQLRQRVAQWMQSIRGDHFISSAQWGKLLQISSELVTHSINQHQSETPIERWNRFWADVEEREKKQLRLGWGAVRIENQRLNHFIADQLCYKHSIPAFLQTTEKINDEHWNLLALELLFRQIIRSRNTANKGSGVS